MNPVEYETVRIEKITKSCPVCERYTQKQASKPVSGEFVASSCDGRLVQASAVPLPAIRGDVRR